MKGNTIENGDENRKGRPSERLKDFLKCTIGLRNNVDMCNRIGGGRGRNVPATRPSSGHYPRLV